MLHKLIEKSSFRLRSAGYTARGVHVGILYRDHGFWHHGRICPSLLSDPRDIYRVAFKILSSSPYRQPVANLSVTLFDLLKVDSLQLDLFKNVLKQSHVVQAMDKINHRYGQFVITPAMMLSAKNLMPDRISFGGVKEIEQFVINR